MELTEFVGLDVHKRMGVGAIAESGRGGEVRFLAEIPSTPEARPIALGPRASAASSSSRNSSKSTASASRSRGSSAADNA